MDRFGRPISLEEELLQTKRDIFIGRDKLVTEFMREAQSGSMTSDTWRVYQYYGVGGIGKSTLREHFIERLEQLPGSVIGVLDFESEAERDLEFALRLLRNSMAKQYKIKFPTFDTAYEMYINGRSPHLAANDGSSPLLEDSDYALDITNVVFKILEDIPWLKLVPQTYKKFTKFHNSYTKRKLKKKMKYLQQFKESAGDREFYSKLPRLFSEDLRSFAAEHTGNVYIFIDTYEALWTNQRHKAYELDVDAWVRTWAEYTPGVTWVIFGREKLRWKEADPRWKKVISHHEVPSMSDQECRSVLAAAGITGEDIVSQIIANAEGLPFSIRLSVDLYNRICTNRQPVHEDFQMVHTDKQLIGRFLKYLTKGEQRSLELLALTRSWDQTLFSTLMAHFRPGSADESLQDVVHYSFIKEGTDKRWEMHALMRKSLREGMEADKSISGNQFLFNYYAKMLESHHFRSTDGQPAFWLGEAFFHGFSLMENGAMEIQAFIDWFRKEDARFFNQGKWGVSINLHRQLIDYLEAEPAQEQKQQLAVIVYDLAFILFMLIRYEEAEKLFRYAKQQAEESYVPDHPFIGKTYYGLATMLQNLGDYPHAEELYLESLRIRESALGKDHLAVALSANNLGSLYRSRGRLEEAKELYLRSIRIRQLPNHYDANKLADGYLNLTRLYHDQENYVEGESVGREALKLKIKVYGFNHMELCQALNHLGNICLRQRQYARAQNFYRKAIRIARSHHAEDAAVMAKIYHNSAVLFHVLEQLEMANMCVEQCLEIQKLYYGVDHYRYQRSLEGLSGLQELAAGSEHLGKIQLEF